MPEGNFLWNSVFSDVLQRALLSCLWKGDVWLLWLAEQLQSRRVVRKLLSCPAPMQGSCSPRPQLLEPAAHGQAGCRECVWPPEMSWWA